MTVIVLGAVLFVAFLVGVFVRDAVQVRESLTAARASLLDVRAAAGAVELGAAAAALSDADAQLGEARSRSGGPLWSVAGRLPGVGGSVRVTQEVVRTASALVDVAERAVDGGGQLLGDGLDVSVQDGQLDLAPLTEAHDLLTSLPTARLVDARDRLAASEPRWAPADVLAGREETLAVADDAIGTITRGESLLAALPSFLGDEEPRRYLLGVQSPAELRGTGGLLGYYAVLEVDQGRFELGDGAVYDAFDDLEDEGPATGDIQQLRGDLDDRVPVSEEYEIRYGHTAAAAFFSNSNVDPDLPTTAEVMLDLFERRTGERLDGVVLFDPIAMERVLAAIGGEIELPTDATDVVDLPATLPASQFAEFALIDVYELLGGDRSPERKLVLRGLGDLAFARVFDGAWDGVAVSRALADSASERHVQVYSREDAERSAFELSGIGGSLAPVDGVDLVTVTANNAVGGKQDVHVGHRVVADVALADPRRGGQGEVTVDRRVDLRVEVHNPLTPDSFVEYIVGNCLVGTPEAGCFDGPPAVNRTWFTAWTPGDARLVRPEGAIDAAVRETQFRGMNAFDRYLETPPASEAGFDLAWAGPAPVRDDSGGELVYDLSWWAQSKAIPTLLELSVSPPDGWRIDSVELAGGGSGQGFGPHAGSGPAAASVDGDGLARLSGAVTADATLSVRLVGDSAG